MPKLTTEQKLAKLEENQNKLLEELSEQKKAREKAEKKLENKEAKELKENDPMSGPGVLCECTSITRSESWQVPNIEFVNPKTKTVETKPDMSMVPDGYVVRYDSTNSVFIVKEGHDNPKHNLQDVIIPVCQSKYTRELTVFTVKPVEDRKKINVNPPRRTLNLCEKHEKMFGAKTQKQVDKENA